MSWDVVESRLMQQPSGNATGFKFYQAAVVHDPLRDLWGVVFNWGAGRGSLSFQDGQVQVNVWSNKTAERTARNIAQAKLTTKLNGGYSYVPIASDKAQLSASVKSQLEAKVPPSPATAGFGTAAHAAANAAGPKNSKPETTFAIDPVATLVSSKMTPALARRIVEEKQGLVALRDKYQGLLDQIEAKIEALDGKLRKELA